MTEHRRRPRAAATTPPARRSVGPERIVEAAVALLRVHDMADITMPMVADQAGLTRTAIYKHFATLGAIFKVISDRVVPESFAFIIAFANARELGTIERVIAAVADGACAYFNDRPEAQKTILGNNSQYQLLDAMPDFDRLSATMFHQLLPGHAWPFEPYSDDDPFLALGLMQSALFSRSTQSFARITPHYAEQAIRVGISFVRASIADLEAKRGCEGTQSDLEERLAAAGRAIAGSGRPGLLETAVEQAEALARLG